MRAGRRCTDESADWVDTSPARFTIRWQRGDREAYVLSPQSTDELG